jgi:hypothetical protein
MQSVCQQLSLNDKCLYQNKLLFLSQSESYVNMAGFPPETVILASAFSAVGIALGGIGRGENLTMTERVCGD